MVARRAGEGRRWNGRICSYRSTELLVCSLYNNILMNMDVQWRETLMQRFWSVTSFVSEFQNE